MIRLFVPHPLGPGLRLELPAEQAHYLRSVMRLGEGAAVHVFNGADGEWLGRLAPDGKRDAALELRERTRPQSTPPDLELLVALVKRARLETVVEKAAELGVRRVRLLTTRRTNADHTRLERLQAIAVEAAEQTGRLDVPVVAAPEPLERVLAGWEGGARRLMFCDEAGDDPAQRWGGEAGRAAPVLGALAGLPRGEPWAVLIGPEGGFDPAERARLRALAGVAPVTLGPRILRADTAAIAALALWQAVLGDWGGQGDRG